MITLYGGATPNARKVAIALEEMALPWRVEIIDILKGDQLTPEFLAINPNNKAPAIIDDEPPAGAEGKPFVLWESGAILLYLAEKSGKLIPRDLQARAQVYRWLITALNNIEPFALPILFADMQGDANPHLKGLRPWHVDILARFLPEIDDRLAKQPFLVGEDFTVADIIFTCVLRELRKNEVLDAYPTVQAYRQRCEARPAFVKMLNAYEDRLGIARGGAK